MSEWCRWFSLVVVCLVDSATEVICCYGGLMNTDAVVTRIRREYDELRRL